MSQYTAPQQLLTIQQRSSDLLRWLLPKSAHFPKLYRHTLVQRIMDSALDFNEQIAEAVSTRGQDRLLRLQIADAKLIQLRQYLYISYEWKWVNLRQFEHVSKIVAEIGRLLGAWIKKCSAK